MTLEFAAYDPALRSVAEGYLRSRGMLDTESPYCAFWRDMLGKGVGSVEAFVVAHDGKEAQGLAISPWRPMFDGRTRMTMFLLPDDDRLNVPVGRGLCVELLRTLAPRDVNKLMLNVEPTQPGLRDIATGGGFTHVESHFTMSWESDGTPAPEMPVEGVSLSFFHGGDVAVAADIATVCNRSFAGDAMVADLTTDDVERLTTADGIWFAVAHETETGTCVGVTEAAPHGTFTAIALARRYWGTGLADWLVAATINEFIRTGRTKLFSTVRTGNRPSIALQERTGWTKVGCTEFYRSDTLDDLEPLVKTGSVTMGNDKKLNGCAGLGAGSN